MEKLAKKLSQIKAGRVLDIATRDGTFIGVLSRNLGHYDEIIGIDITDKGFEKAREKFAGNDRIRFEVMDGCHTSFPDHSFDLVCISNSLHHVGDLPALFREMQRLKKSDGWILINELPSDRQTGGSLTHSLIHGLDCLVDSYHGHFHHSTYTHKEIYDMIAASGIKIVEEFDILEEADAKNAVVAARVDKIPGKLGTCEGAPNYQEMADMARRIMDNYRDCGAHTAVQYILLAK
jgi:ubiquinone/menaquinone biosynthesis C-methylase UbiE